MKLLLTLVLASLTPEELITAHHSSSHFFTRIAFVFVLRAAATFLCLFQTCAEDVRRNI